jgi:raffinose/stachyose/melibiose transport system permease protein
MFVNSFKDRFSIYTNTFGLPEAWNFSNYSEVMASGRFTRYLTNSVFVVLVSLFLVLVFGILVSYALALWHRKIAIIIYYFLIIGMIIPNKITSIKLLEIIRYFGLQDSIWALIPIYVAMGIPVAVFVLTEFIRQIPTELSEAARMDGCCRFHVMTCLILPLLRPALIVVCLYNLVPFWNDLWFPLILISSEEQKTLLLGVTRLFAQYQTDWSKVLAVLMLASLPVLVLFLMMSKQFIKSVTIGVVID